MQPFGTKRHVAFAGTSMIDNAKMAKKLGYLDIPENIQVNLDQALHLPDKEVVIMCTGSQGEPSSILGRLSRSSYRAFSIQPGDTVVLSAHPIPGNEENVFRTINLLIQHGADVIYEAIAPVHVSGHASQEEIKLMLNLVRPAFLYPHPWGAAPPQAACPTGETGGHPGTEYCHHREWAGP